MNAPAGIAPAGSRYSRGSTLLRRANARHTDIHQGEGGVHGDRYRRSTRPDRRGSENTHGVAIGQHCAITGCGKTDSEIRTGEWPPAPRQLSPLKLNDSPWVALSPSQEDVWLDRFLTACVAAGFRPDIRAHATMQSTVLGLVEAGMGRAFVLASAARKGHPGLRFRRLAWWRHQVEIWVGWRPARLLPSTARFLELNELT